MTKDNITQWVKGITKGSTMFHRYQHINYMQHLQCLQPFRTCQDNLFWRTFHGFHIQLRSHCIAIAGRGKVDLPAGHTWPQLLARKIQRRHSAQQFLKHGARCSTWSQMQYMQKMERSWHHVASMVLLIIHGIIDHPWYY